MILNVKNVFIKHTVTARKRESIQVDFRSKKPGKTWGLGEKLGNLRTAKRPFLSLERKLSRNLNKLYTDFVSDYESTGHMTFFTDALSENKPLYFLPHYDVLKRAVQALV